LAERRESGSGPICKARGQACGRDNVRDQLEGRRKTSIEVNRDRAPSRFSAHLEAGPGGPLAIADIDGDSSPELLVHSAGNASQTGPNPDYKARLYAIRLP
jgi:hypothetical protein